MTQMMYETDDAFYSQATDSGAYDDVSMPTGGVGDYLSADLGNVADYTQGVRGAVTLIVLSLATLWFLGAFMFKGSNQS